MICSTSLIIILSLMLDWKLGEFRRWHPLVGFGNFANRIEARLNNSAHNSQLRLLLGCLGWGLAVIPFVFIAYLSSEAFPLNSVYGGVIGAVVLYFAIGWQSLISHAKAVSRPLMNGNLENAQHAVAMIVSRDTRQLNEEQIASAATESVLENGTDAIYGALFWFVVLGVPGVVLYRLSNTLDAMWGYKNERYLYFGRMAARMDDLLNFVPARLTALSYCLMGNYELASASWRAQGRAWKSPNAGPVMASGAGAINVRLGGGALYHGEWQERPSLGPQTGEQPSAESIEASIGLVNRSLALWVVMLPVISVVVCLRL